MRSAMIVCLLVMYAVPGDAHDRTVTRFKAVSANRSKDRIVREVMVSHATCWLADLKDAGLKGKGLIVTAAHTLKCGEKFYLEWGYQWLEAKLVFKDDERDVAVLKASIKLSGTKPRKLLKDRELVFYGSGHGKRVTAHTVLPDKVVLNEKVELGHSGSPVVNGDKRVVGMVIAGTGPNAKDPGNGLFVHAASIRAAIATHLKARNPESPQKK